MSRHNTRSRPEGDHGTTAVEVALVLPILLLLLGGLLVLGLRMTYAALAGHTAELALSQASLRSAGSYPTAATIDTAVRATSLSGLLGGPTTPVAVTVVQTTARKRQGDRVTVTVTYDVPAVRTAAALLPGLGGVLDDLAVITTTVQGRLE